MAKHSIRQILINGVRLMCPRCGVGRMFAGMFTMHPNCPSCHFKFEREQGYFLGAMYINYGVTVIITFVGYFAVDYLTEISLYPKLILWGIFSVLFPVYFFRYSRSLWANFDYTLNPSEPPPSADKKKS